MSMKTILFFTAAIAAGHSIAAQETDERKDVSVLTAKIAMIPDSIKVETRDETFYLLAVEDFQAVFFTSNRGLLDLISEHIMADTIANDGIRNIVWIQGTLISPLTKFYKRQFRFFNSHYKKMGMGLNGYKIYRLTAHLTDFEDEQSPKMYPPWIAGVEETPAQTEQPTRKVVTGEQQSTPRSAHEASPPAKRKRRVQH